MSTRRWLRSVSAMLGGACCLMSAAPALACDDDDSDGLDVGLVLSGGGALLSTHIGAIEVIEELGVPIHCVVGTSMGGVVAALYAGGYDSQDLRAVFLDNDWGAVVRGEFERSDKTFLQTEREREYFTNYLAGWNEEGLTLPGGLTTMRGLRLFFRDLLQFVPIESDFDEFEIPFRVVAMDLSTGQAKAFDHGDVVESMLATMAVPGAFRPREIDGQYYVDGGMVAQLPIDVARDMGADIIIAIDSTVPPSQITSDISVPAMTQQIIRISVWNNFQEQISHLTDDDVLIRADLGDMGPASFDRAAFGIASGIVAANEHVSALEVIRDRAAPARRRTMDRDTSPLDSDTMTIVNNSSFDDDVIRTRFGYIDSFDDNSDLVGRRLMQLAAASDFEEVDLARGEDGAVLTVHERPLGRNLVQVGLRASNDFTGNSTFSLLGRYTRQPFSRRGGVLNASAEFGTNLGLSVELQQPLGPGGRYFVRPEFYYLGEQINFDIGDVRLAELWREEIGARFDVGRELGAWGVVALTSELGAGNLEPQITIFPGFDDPIDFSQAGVGALFAVDTLDRTDWPTGGRRLNLRAQRFYELDDSDDVTDEYDVAVTQAVEVGSFGMLLNAQYSVVENEKDEPADILFLGGFRRLSAYAQDTLPNDQFYFGSVEVFRRITPSSGVVNVPIYVGAIGEFAHAEFDFLAAGVSEDFYSLGVYLGLETPIGPVLFGGAIGDDETRSLFFYVGTAF